MSGLKTNSIFLHINRLLFLPFLHLLVHDVPSHRSHSFFEKVFVLLDVEVDDGSSKCKEGKGLFADELHRLLSNNNWPSLLH